MRADIPTAALMLMIPALAWATTLRLSTEVDLLVLDGRRVSSSLLKGAGSIEIDNGPHQLVMKVEKNPGIRQRDKLRSPSVPLVVSFDSKEIEQVNIILSHKDAEHSVSSPQIKLLDGHLKPIPVRTDILETRPDPTGADYEEEIKRYNKAGKKASMPGFATAGDKVQNFTSAKPDILASPSEAVTEQRLKYWFSLADKSTRTRFLRWAQETSAR